MMSIKPFPFLYLAIIIHSIILAPPALAEARASPGPIVTEQISPWSLNSHMGLRWYKDRKGSTELAMADRFVSYNFALQALYAMDKLPFAIGGFFHVEWIDDAGMDGLDYQSSLADIGPVVSARKRFGRFEPFFNISQTILGFGDFQVRNDLSEPGSVDLDTKNKGKLVVEETRLSTGMAVYWGSIAASLELSASPTRTISIHESQDNLAALLSQSLGRQQHSAKQVRYRSDSISLGISWGL